MTAWQFSTESCSKMDRGAAWRATIQRLSLPTAHLKESAALHGDVYCVASGIGLEFARITSSPQAIGGLCPNQPNAMWLGVLLEGKARLTVGDKIVTLGPNDIMYGPTGQNALLTFETDFRQLFVRLSASELGSRLLTPLVLKVGHLSGGSGIAHVLASMLRSTADTIDDLTDDQIHPLKIALIELLLAALSVDARAMGGASVRTALFYRICQTIESRLSDPDMSLHMAASLCGISTRYLQKVFRSANQGFGDYLRQRRLERCRADLANPLHAHLSISEICFRWGFNGSAHFSHSFRDQYGESPREYRRRVGGRPAPAASRGLEEDKKLLVDA